MTPYLQVFFTVARKQRGGFQLSGIGAKKHCMMPLHPIRNLLRYNTPISCFFPTYVIIIVTAILLGLMHKCSFSESRWAIWTLFIVWQKYGLGATYIYSASKYAERNQYASLNATIFQKLIIAPQVVWKLFCLKAHKNMILFTYFC